MKKLSLLSFMFLLFLSGCDTAKSIIGSINNGNLTNDEVVHGLKEALKVGTDSSAHRLSLLNGFYKDAAIKILMPPEAQKVEKTLRDVGFGSVVDKAILSMNRAAEDASKSVGNIFLNAIKQMTIQDAFGILRGGNFAATDYLKQKSTPELITAFTPVISKSLDNTNATKYWKDVFTAYNRFSKNPVNTDLTGYVTQKALDGLFYQIGLEEQKIRQDPAARVTDILKKVFANQNR
ncbi:DUF4197 domain-containing protein [Ginsengibacter hankyongi]|uniref:DUF4197 domain-containing protein n=1 Tax=Ginsengibacter hankyongi TaxID=2607284 RepID=A0A5J5IFC6_9BACT|nr:DUF4197 domain-containing protein [Ginsengibacter hankyongi]KAA9037307.1 DUF4197 domain-containing protein [Ginsengibacter hankyongi]